MTTISANLGGSGAVAPGGQPQVWRQPQYVRTESINWMDPQYATPKPAPPRQLGRRVEPLADVPVLPERNIRVRAVPPATRYTLDGLPIPAEQWVTVPISPEMLQGIKDGDLERGPDPTDEEAPPDASPDEQEPAPPPPDQPVPPDEEPTSQP